jgi:hypothetical protein
LLCRHDFNQPVNNLPNSITHLTFGVYFNQQVDATRKNEIFTGAPKNKIVFDGDNLPNSITHLTFGVAFDKPVDKLPNSITHLTLGTNFNQPVNNLPNSITYLRFGYCFDQLFDKLPKSIKKLGFTSNNKIKNNIPENIENIEIVFFNNGNDSIIEKISMPYKTN